MSEDEASYEAKKGNIEPKSVSKEEIEKAETAAAVQLEIEKIHSLPDDYWLAEWRKHVRALGITSDPINDRMLLNLKPIGLPHERSGVMISFTHQLRAEFGDLSDEQVSES